MGLERGDLPVPLRRARELAERSRQRAVRRPQSSSSTRTSTGATIAGRTRRGTGRSSTKRTSRASPHATRSIPEELRGTYAGLAHPVAIKYLQKLGVTAVELLPVHQFVQDSTLLERGLRNYWGYNSIGYLAPHNEYRARRQRGEQVQEFKQLVKTLHAAGIEVILDVVYNHTAEGNHLGPMLSFKGIDNAAYYRLVADNRRYYMDYTGTGNTLNMRHPHVLQLIMDSLRYWVIEMHVDGFRFDLAATLARELHDVDRLSAFFDLIQQDPVVSQVKLIAEPWDIGEGGYQVGNFPPLWSEWNGKYRDTVRDFWRGTDQTLAEFAYAIHRQLRSVPGHGARGRTRASTSSPRTTASRCAISSRTTRSTTRPTARTTATARATTARGTAARRGRPTTRTSLALRRRQQRNFLTTLFLSQGVPMLLGGDEIGRTQRGNNNAYCQDNEISWFDWEHADHDLLQFTRGLIRLRQRHPVFCRRRWFQGRPIHGTEVSDIGWFTPGRHRDVRRGLARRASPSRSACS